MIVVKQFFYFFLCSFLISCSSSKKPLVGKRESIHDMKVENHISLKDKDLPEKSFLNTSWNQQGGNKHNNMSSVYFSQNPKIVKTLKIDASDIIFMVSDQDTLFMMDKKGRVMAYHILNDEKLWEVETALVNEKHNVMGGGLLVVDGVLIATTSFGDVYALDVKTGKVTWKKTVSSPIRSGATADKGLIFFVTVSNETYALDQKTGSVVWQHQGISEISTLFGLNTPAVSNDVLVTAYTSGEVYALDAQSGEVLWMDTLTPALRSDTVSSIGHIKANPIIDGHHVYLVSHGGKTVCIDLKNGQRVWEKDIGGSHNASITGNIFLMIDHADTMYALNKKTGEVFWKNDLKNQLSEKKNVCFLNPIILEKAVSVSATNGEIFFYSLKDAKLMNTINIEKRIASMPIVVSKKMYVPSINGSVYIYQ